MTLTVRPLTADDYEDLRDIRLEALRLHPEAFCSDLEAEEAMAKEAWLARLSGAVSFGGFLGGQLDGIAVYARPTRKKLAHTGDLNAMYVRERARGKGLGDALVRAVVERAAAEVEQLRLTVNADNLRAIKLYERHGFRVCGRIPHAIHIGGRYYDELVMIRGVSPSD